MIFAELFITNDTLTPARRRQLGERLLAELIGEEGAPETVLAGARRLTSVVIHQPEHWVFGGDQADDGPRYLVRLTVPGSWNGKEMGAYLIPGVTKAIAAFDDDPDRLYREPSCWVQIVGVREHSLGTMGEVITSAEITKLITREYRESDAPAPEPEPGTAIDPVCGMVVDLATATITLDHDGVGYAFCAPVCRKVFLEEHTPA